MNKILLEEDTIRSSSWSIFPRHSLTFPTLRPNIGLSHSQLPSTPSIYIPTLGRQTKTHVYRFILISLHNCKINPSLTSNKKLTFIHKTKTSS
jgi:hypothetical protein